MSRPIELFSQIGIIYPNMFPSFFKYAERYCKGYQGKFGYDASGADHLIELSKILEHTVMIRFFNSRNFISFFRRMKNDVLDDLPPKTREILYLSGEKLQERMNSLRKSREYYEKCEASVVFFK